MITKWFQQDMQHLTSVCEVVHVVSISEMCLSSAVSVSGG